jgi:hypothetical protein
MIPNLSEMPQDGQTRDAVIDSSFAQPGPEQQPVTKQGRKVETTAATAAAILGMFFSKTQNVDMGVRLEENDLVDRKHAHQPEGAGSGNGEHDDDQEHTRTDPAAPANELVPWVHIAP